MGFILVACFPSFGRWQVDLNKLIEVWHIQDYWPAYCCTEKSLHPYNSSYFTCRQYNGLPTWCPMSFQRLWVSLIILSFDMHFRASLVQGRTCNFLHQEEVLCFGTIMKNNLRILILLVFLVATSCCQERCIIYLLA